MFSKVSLYLVASALVLAACSDDEPTAAKKKGTGGSSGSEQTGGSSNTGGSADTGGSSGVGGSDSDSGSDSGNATDSSTEGGAGDASDEGSTGVGGSTGTETPPDGKLNLLAGGYVDQAPIKGSAFTSSYSGKTADAGVSSITPVSNFATLKASSAGALCAKGNVGADADYGGGATLGVNINQPAGGAISSWTPTGTGIAWEIKNPGDSPIRLVVSEAAGEGGTGKQWCKNLTGTSGTVTWSEFKTECWGSSGTAYANEPIVDIQFQVNGSNTADIPFDFCVQDLKIAN